MPVNSITQVSNEFSQALANKESTGSSLDKEAFMLLLVTQFQYQDPLNPMDDKEFISQMAQFSSLEQMMNINETMEGITDAVNNQAMFNATNYIGKYVTTTGNVIGKTSTSTTGADGSVTTTSSVTPYYYTFTGNASQVTIQVFDTSSTSGTPVYTEQLGGMTQYNTDGSLAVYKFNWNGLTSNGQPAPDGTYKVVVTAADDGVLVGTQLVADKVTDVLRNGSEIMLRLQGGQYMSLADVEQVSESDPQISTVPGTDDDKDDNTGSGSGSTDGTDGSGSTDGTDGSDSTDSTDGTDGSGSTDGTDTGSGASA